MKRPLEREGRGNPTVPPLDPRHAICIILGAHPLAKILLALVQAPSLPGGPRNPDLLTQGLGLGRQSSRAFRWSGDEMDQVMCVVSLTAQPLGTYFEGVGGSDEIR